MSLVIIKRRKCSRRGFGMSADSTRFLLSRFASGKGEIFG
jgi:hypothetical protein